MNADLAQLALKNSREMLQLIQALEKLTDKFIGLDQRVTALERQADLANTLVQVSK